MPKLVVIFMLWALSQSRFLTLKSVGLLRYCVTLSVTAV
jgi:hypothetical protein